jgi:ssDNA thymidine ADP-ribosyltransferase, DarT
MRVSRDQLIAHRQRWSDHPLHIDAPWVPKYLYHFTDVKNAAAILQSGELLSRNEAIQRNVMVHDNASSHVIEVTPPLHRDFARLYFRPRTPTQFHNEGIRPVAARTFDKAHCPVPVFLLFDLVETLALDGVMFSDGNMAAGHVVFSEQSDVFAKIPFELVYHEGPIDPQLRAKNVIHHRHAEVLAPRALSLNTLKWIGCRSNAERESLLHLLGATYSIWEKRISVAGERLFNMRGCCVQSVFVDRDEAIQFTLHIPNAWSVRIRFELASEQSDKVWHWNSGGWSEQLLRLSVRGIEPGVVRLYIEDCLAYVARAQPADVPF